jgi:neutral ceramidase
MQRPFLAAIGVTIALLLHACGDSAPLGSAGIVQPAPDPGEPKLMAGVASAALQIPVGTPLGGYLRPPVGGDYLPGLEAFGGGDPSQFFAEFLDFIPAIDDEGNPLAPIPDELRTITSPYATLSPPSRGYYDSLVAKAVALHDGSDYVVFLKTDLIGSLDELAQGITAQVLANTGIDLGDALVISATHTHDGPGAVANHSARYFWAAMDAYQPSLLPRILPQLAAVVEGALANLQPARVGHGFGREGYEHPIDGVKHLNSFRRDRLESYDLEANDALRERIGVIRVDTVAGAPLAFILNYAVHGIAFDVENQYFSGDVAASAEREIEQTFDQPVVAMLVQNTGGDVSPRADGGPTLQRIERFGKLMAPQARAIYDGIGTFDHAPDIRVVAQRVVLSRAHLGYTGTEFPYPWGGAQCNNEAAVPFVDVGTGETIPFCVPGTAPDPQDLADNGVGENGALLPQDTRLMAIKLGAILIVPQPGEPLTEYGVRLLQLAQAEGFAPQDTFIWGYANDHIGYILAPEKADWDMGGVEGTTTFWGWKQGQRFLDGNVELIRALRDGTPPPPDEFDVAYTYDAIYDAIPGPTALPALQPGRIVFQPEAIERFQQTTFAWEGGDPVVDAPDVLLERMQGDGSWAPMRRANGTPMNTLFEMHLKYRLVTAAHVWSLDLEPNLDWPQGTYRFRAAGRAPDDYAVESESFTIAASPSLVISEPARTGDAVEVTLAYTPRPGNYRLIEPLVPTDQPAPVRLGAVTFSNGTHIVTDESPDLEVRDDRLVAVYRATISGSVTASGRDAFGNKTP